MKHLPFLFSIVILTSCSQGEMSAMVQTDKFVLRSEISKISNAPIHTKNGNISDRVSSGEWISYVDDIDQFIIAYPADYPKDYPVFMSDMSIERPSDPYANCVHLGVSAPLYLRDDKQAIKAQWGVVDYFDGDQMDHFGEITPLCRPNSGKDAAAYAFCSAHNGKEVLICISQVTDNPTLAKKIFDTFRWTK